ncbi:hypothetical protein VE04_09272, partial [Pseudogymnoascus sp. 24MN13]
MDKARATAASTAVAQPQMIPPRTRAGSSTTQAKRSPLAVAEPAPAPASKVRNSVMAPDAFSSSAVTENGSYEFDRRAEERLRARADAQDEGERAHFPPGLGPSWKQIYLVLRPTSISIYKDQDESKLRHKILLSDLTAVAFLKDPKHKRHNALSKPDAAEWVDLIGREARTEPEEEEMFLASPTTNMTHNYAGLDAEMRRRTVAAGLRDVPLETQRRSSSAGRSPARSGTEPASHSDFSDVETHFNPSLRPKAAGASQVSIPEIGEPSAPPSQQQQRPIIPPRNGSQLSGLNITPDADPGTRNLARAPSLSQVEEWGPTMERPL